MKAQSRFSTVAMAMLLASPLFAQDLTDVEEIVKKTNHAAYYQGEDGRARVKMTIVDQSGQERTRELTILRKDAAGEEDSGQFYYAYFHRPADVRETVFMVHKHLDKDDDRWLYLPALDVVKRIAASDERTSFVGSHFFYEDVSGRGLDEDTHELVETTGTYYVIKNTPKDTGKVQFDSYTMWIEKTAFIPVKVEYEKGGTAYRTTEVLEVKDIQGYKTVTQAKMTDTKMGGHTIAQYDDVAYDTGLPEDIFTERYLRNAPREHLK